MSQTSYIAAAIVLGFIVFVTIRGELPGYKVAILGAPAPTQQAGA